jgi:hypothetical protein
MDTTIHTINARDNVMLEVARDYFSLSPESMRLQIHLLKNELERILKTKKINYNDLKSSLIPDKKKKEIVLVFDWSLIDNDWYGNEVFKALIPILNKDSCHSILVGDYLGNNFDQQFLYESLSETINVRNTSEYKHSSQYYMVYINNLSHAMFSKFDDELKHYNPYIGYADMTYSSTLKTLLSTMLVDLCIKHKNIILQPHESDRDESHDVNMSGYPFEENNFICKSISSDLYGVLLSYKIERPVIDGFEEDTYFALNAINLKPQALDSMDVVVEDAKMKYLQSFKGGSLSVAGLEHYSSKDLASEIKRKINSSYIYSMSYSKEHDTAKFNILLEFKNPKHSQPVKLLAGMKYIPTKNTLHLITLF